MNDYYGYETTDALGSIASTSDLFSTIMAIIGVMSIFIFALSIVMLVANWIIYKKAGKPGWASIIPIYNMIVLLEIAGLPLWYFVLFFIPFANIYLLFKMYIELAHKFGKSTGFGVLTVFFSYITLPILAFSKAKYEGNVEEQTNNNSTQNTAPIEPIVPPVMPTMEQPIATEIKSVIEPVMQEPVNIPNQEFASMEPIIPFVSNNSVPSTENTPLTPNIDPLNSFGAPIENYNIPVMEAPSAETFVENITPVEPVILSGGNVDETTNIEPVSMVSPINAVEPQMVSTPVETPSYQAPVFDTAPITEMPVINEAPVLETFKVEQEPVINPIPTFESITVAPAMELPKAEEPVFEPFTANQTASETQQISEPTFEPFMVKQTSNQESINEAGTQFGQQQTMIEQNIEPQIVNPPKSELKTCPSCGIILPSDSDVCFMCGTKIQ